MWYLVAALDEDYRPLANVRIEAIALWSWPDVADSKTTGQDGTAIFSSLGGSVYFKACTPRYSGGARDRTFRGDVKIQVVGIWGDGQMNADMVVDSNGKGTHLTLFGASGALEAAIALGANTETFIWICATHSESRTATHTISMLSANQRIIIMGGGQFEHNIHFNFNGPAITHNDGSGDGAGAELLFEHMGFTRDTGKSGAFMEVSGGGYVVKLWFNDVDFSAAGTWTYLLDYDTATSGIFRGLTLNGCTGVMNAIAATTTAGSAVGHLIMHDCDMALVNLIERDDNTDVDLFTELIVTNNKLTVSGYLLKLAYTHASTEEVTISGNVFLHTGAVNFIELGTAASNNISRVTIVGNTYYGSAGGCAFALLDVATGAFLGVAIVGNSLTGPGSGTAITVNDTATDCLFLNAYYGWDTNLTGAPTGIPPGEIGYTPGDGADWVDPDPDDVAEGLDDLAKRLQDVTEVDFFVGTATGELSAEIVCTYARGSIIYGGASAWGVLPVGVAGTYLAADGTDVSWTNLTDYSVTLGLDELEISDANFFLGLVTNPKIVFDTGSDDLYYDRASNVYHFRVGGSDILTADANAVKVDVINELTGAAGVTVEGTKLLDSLLELAEITKPANPADGYGRLYMKNDDKVYFLATGGTEYDLTAAVVAPGHAILDGSVHTDSMADAVSRGSLIYGNATPKWDELTVGAYGSVLRADGTDAYWSTSLALAGTLLVDAINEYSGSAGVTVEGVLLKDTEITLAKDGNIDLALGATDANTTFLVDYPNISTANALFRIFRQTNTSGSADFQIFKADGTTTLAFEVQADQQLVRVPGTLTVNTINEYTGAVGVTIEGSLLKDSIVYPVSTDANFHLGASIFGCPFIMFDAGSDYLIYDRPNNEFQFWIGGAIELKIDPLRVWMNEDLEVDGGLTVGDATPGDDFLLLKFNTSRAWQFETDGADGASQALALRALVDNKSFWIGGSGSQKILEVQVGSTPQLGFFGVTPAARASAYTTSNVSADRAFDANATTIDELADVLATLIADLKTYGLLQ